MKLEISNKV